MAINGTQFLEALEGLEATKGISKTRIIEALKEAMARGYRKQLGGDDADVRVLINESTGEIEMNHVKKIVKDIEDDFLELTKADAKELEKQGQGYIEGDEFVMPVSVEELKKATAMSIKSILRQKFAEAEKDILFETFKDKIDTMMTGKVEKMDAHGCSVSLGKTSVYLPHSQMIGDEVYNAGDPIRVYVSKVENGSKSTQILVSRSNEGFLKTLFFEEIREVYDGTIVIKNIAREAGERSKVAVYSSNPDIDPAGSCIGPNGTRIQKIVTQLGNGIANKEKIDIIAWSENPGVFIMESLKPARVCGIIYDEKLKTATVVVKDDSLSLAIGRKGVNARLAVKLTGYNIDIKTETDALEEGLEYQSFAELHALEDEAKALRSQAARLAEYERLTKTSSLPGLPNGYVAPQERVYEEEVNDFDETLSEKVETEEAYEETPEVETVKAEEPAPVVETVKVEEKVEEKAEVKTTTTISDLEKSLESAANKKTTAKKSYKKSEKKEEEEKPIKKEIKPAAPKMEISYSEEELAEIEKQESEDYDYDEDIDYDEFDEYYDEEN